MQAMAIHSRVLLSSEKLYHVNLTHADAAASMVRRLVQLDRLPKENPIEGLLILRSAWDDHDIAIMLARRYKRLCKLAFLMQLGLSWLAVASATVGQYLSGVAGMALGQEDLNASSLTVDISPLTELPDPETAAVLVTVSEVLGHVVFAITLGISFVLALDTMVNSKSRWRQLRAGAGALQSVIWLYRTRCGDFELDDSNRNSGA